MEKIPVEFGIPQNRIVGYVNSDNNFELLEDIFEFMKGIDILNFGVGKSFVTISHPVEKSDGTQSCHIFASLKKTERTIFEF